MRRSAIPYSQTQPRCPTYGRGCALIPWAIDDFIKHLDTQYNTQTIQRWKETNTQNIQPKELLKSYCSPIVKLPGLLKTFDVRFGEIKSVGVDWPKLMMTIRKMKTMLTTIWWSLARGVNRRWEFQIQKPPRRKPNVMRCQLHSNMMHTLGWWICHKWMELHKTVLSSWRRFAI